MRLALRFAVAITIGVGAVLALQAVLHVQRIGELQEAEIRANVITLARALSRGTEEVWILGGRESAANFAQRANDTHDRTQIAFRDVREGETALNASRVQRLSTAGGTWSIVAVAPVTVDGRYVGVLEIERELPSEREYFNSILRTQIATTLVAAFLAGLIALSVGAWFVGRPIQSLSELARRVARGEYSLRSEIVQADDVGDLAHELDAMTERLEEGREKVQSEHRARLQTLERLRHADRLSTVGRMASSLAHELGTPLNVVSGRATMIASDEALPGEARQNALRIAEQAERMTSTIHRTLEFSRSQPLERKETSIASVLEDAISLLQPILDDKGVVICTKGDTSVVAAIDADKILQVITNLIMNSVAAMPGGGTITIEIKREHVTDPKDPMIGCGDYIEISVCDEGGGIPEERLSKIFDAFATSKVHGTGLGLSVCQDIVREHDGWIEVESEVGRGSLFAVHLPESEAE